MSTLVQSHTPHYQVLLHLMLLYVFILTLFTQHAQHKAPGSCYINVPDDTGDQKQQLQVSFTKKTLSWQ